MRQTDVHMVSEMSRYIDAQEAFNLLADAPQAIVPKAIWKVGIRSILDQCNAIDIVRCKECKWADFYTTAEKEQYCYCLETDRGGRTADDFCSYGEREGE